MAYRETEVRLGAGWEGEKEEEEEEEPRRRTGFAQVKNCTEIL